ncbi:MAG: hypothetical protein AB7K24_14600 [Gemmataceae bacterium]
MLRDLQQYVHECLLTLAEKFAPPALEPGQVLLARLEQDLGEARCFALDVLAGEKRLSHALERQQRAILVGCGRIRQARSDGQRERARRLLVPLAHARGQAHHLEEQLEAAARASAAARAALRELEAALVDLRRRLDGQRGEEEAALALLALRTDVSLERIDSPGTRIARAVRSITSTP